MSGNLEHSVRDRLQNLARGKGRPFQEVLQYYGLERFLYRLSQSKYSEQFLLKGALLLRVWGAEESRPTRDIDLLGYVDNELVLLAGIIREVCEVRAENDGLIFDPNTITAETIKEHADYQGARVRFTGFLGRARIPMQIDIGFGDVVHPAAQWQSYPTMLALPAPTLRMYPRETAIAEKFEAITTLGAANSRMKDFFDLWWLSRQFDFEGSVLAEAISRTFENRGTTIRADPVGLSAAFTTSRTVQLPWAAFLRKSNLATAPATLEELREPIREFILPVAMALVEGRKYEKVWTAPGPWR